MLSPLASLNDELEDRDLDMISQISSAQNYTKKERR